VDAWRRHVLPDEGIMQVLLYPNADDSKASFKSSLIDNELAGDASVRPLLQATSSEFLKDRQKGWFSLGNNLGVPGH
jgi:hypothetical protein